MSARGDRCVASQQDSKSLLRVWAYLTCCPLVRPFASLLRLTGDARLEFFRNSLRELRLKCKWSARASRLSTYNPEGASRMLVSRCDPRVAGAPEGCRFAAAWPNNVRQEDAARDGPCAHGKVWASCPIPPSLSPALSLIHHSSSFTLAWVPQALLLRRET